MFLFLGGFACLFAPAEKWLCMTNAYTEIASPWVQRTCLTQDSNTSLTLEVYWYTSKRQKTAGDCRVNAGKKLQLQRRA